MRHVTVFTHYSTVDAFLSTYDALIASQGPHFTLKVAAPDFAARELSAVVSRWCPQATILTSTDLQSIAVSLDDGNPVLLLPSAPCVALQGLASSISLLESEPSVRAVSGLIIDDSGQVTSDGYTTQESVEGRLQLLIGIEETDEMWKQVGRNAVVNIVGPTSFSFVRAGAVTPAMCADSSGVARIVAQALNPMSTPLAPTLLFSGLLLRTGIAVLPNSFDDGHIEILPAEVHSAWVAHGVNQVKVLHTGYAVRDDRNRNVVYVHDKVVRAVDEEIITETAPTSEALLSPSYKRQLGPAFTNALPAFTAQEVTTRNQPEHWGTYEHRVVALAKRLDSALPHRVRTWARSYLQRT